MATHAVTGRRCVVPHNPISLGQIVSASPLAEGIMGDKLCLLVRSPRGFWGTAHGGAGCVPQKLKKFLIII